jgi:hypothetical protein
MFICTSLVLITQLKIFVFKKNYIFGAGDLQVALIY